jgi:hypothetical protein
MNKILPTLLATGFILFGAGKLYAYTTVIQDCDNENVYTEHACEGIKAKREFFDKWYRPPMPFYYTTIESTSLPETAWISPDFNPSDLNDDMSSDDITDDSSDGSDLYPPGDESCPPVCN